MVILFVFIQIHCSRFSRKPRKRYRQIVAIVCIIHLNFFHKSLYFVAVYRKFHQCGEWKDVQFKFRHSRTKRIKTNINASTSHHLRDGDDGSACAVASIWNGGTKQLQHGAARLCNRNPSHVFYGVQLCADEQGVPQCRLHLYIRFQGDQSSCRFCSRLDSFIRLYFGACSSLFVRGDLDVGYHSGDSIYCLEPVLFDFQHGH